MYKSRNSTERVVEIQVYDFDQIRFKFRINGKDLDEIPYLDASRDLVNPQPCEMISGKIWIGDKVILNGEVRPWDIRSFSKLINEATFDELVLPKVRTHSLTCSPAVMNEFLALIAFKRRFALSSLYIIESFID